MKDIIDERNERERIGKSIIKYWNVRYQPLSPLSKAPKGTAEESDALAEPDGLKGTETENECLADQSGISLPDGVTKEQIESILSEKSDAFRDFLESSINGER
ncbi:MAG: hypothetical protein PUB98_06350 [Clostridiales bacterium]|nr:hypothetical protein [Clostridiales bacterium]